MDLGNLNQNKLRIVNKILGLTLLALCAGSLHAERFHCPQDTAVGMAIIREFSTPGGDPAELCAAIAAKFVGTPYAEVTKEDTLGVAELRFDAFDQFSFVNSVAALARTATSPGVLLPRDIENALEKMSFRHGEADGFPTRMLYGGDWAIDNKARKNVRELTEDYSDQFKTKSLTWVTRHRQEYPALADSATYERQRMLEMGFRTMKIPHMKRESTEWKEISPELRDGDLIMLLTNNPDKDIYDMGYLVKRADGMHLIHASETARKVVEEPETIGRFIRKRAKEIYGWRWFRIL